MKYVTISRLTIWAGLAVFNRQSFESCLIDISPQIVIVAFPDTSNRLNRYG